MIHPVMASGDNSALTPPAPRFPTKPIGRPSTYSKAIIEEICARIMEGEGLRSICADDHMPNRDTVFRWLQIHKEFSDQYAQARDIQADTYAEMMTEIADENPKVEMPSKHGYYTITDGAGIQRNRLRWDNLKWHASKLAPKKYGEKLPTDHAGNLVQPIVNITLQAPPVPERTDPAKILPNFGPKTLEGK